MKKAAERETISVPLSKLVIADDENIRKELTNLDALQDSIAANGLLQPIVVTEADGGNYRVVAGFRRAHAVKNLKHAQVKATVVSGEPDTIKVIQVIENLQREELTPYETAEALKHLMDTYEYSRDDVARKLSKSNAWVSNYLGVFDLPETVQTAVKDGRLGVAHVRSLHAQIKKCDTKTLVKHAEKIAGLSQDGVKAYFDKALPDTKKDADKAGKSMGAPTKAAPTAVETLPAANVYDGMRTRANIMDTMDALNTEMDEAKTDDARVRLQAVMDALMWVLGDDEIQLSA